MARLALILIMISGLIAGCASDAKRRSEQDMIVVDKKSDRQIVAEFDGAYATALEKGEISLGDDRYVVEHEGKTYYFGSAEAKTKFEQKLEDNSQHADHNWQNTVVGSRQPS